MNQAAGCIVIARSTGRILIQQRSEACSEPFTWATWSGMLEPGETPEECCLRELREESGRLPQETDALTPLFVFNNGHFRHSSFALIIDEEFEPRSHWEICAYRWLRFGELVRHQQVHYGLRAMMDNSQTFYKIRQLSMAFEK